jgi:hypothetical protein
MFCEGVAPASGAFTSSQISVFVSNNLVFLMPHRAAGIGGIRSFYVIALSDGK